ncbi:restriction endonuclease subunit S [Algoriphagus ratkowskyi]|nr:restriction endonuclease subunit S [Algoriphagus ratkowskyi]
MKLLEHFKELTIHPKNAQELKGLILQLAVQGKLTKKWREENSDVEPASKLFDRIQAEKKKLLAEKKIKKINILPEISSDEISNSIPSTWLWVRFDEIVVNRDGERKPITKSDRLHGKYDYYGASGIIDKVEDYLFDKDLLLIGEDGANLIARSTPIAFFARGKYWVNNHAHVIDSIEFEILEYLEKYINAINLEDYITGMAQPKMPQKRMNLIVVPLPPLEEQKAIVSIVNQLFKEVEELERETKARIQLKEDFVTSALNQLANGDTATEWAYLQPHFHIFFTEKSSIKKFRESILQLAVQGKLTRDWRSSVTLSARLPDGQGVEVEHASILLDRIRAEKAQLIKAGKIKKEKPLPEITDEEIPYELPEGWVWCRFQEIFDIRDGTHDSPKDALGPNTYPLVTSKNFNNGEIDFETARRISLEDYLKVIQRSQVHSGDILFSMIGGNIGNQVEVGIVTEFAIKNVALFKHYRYGLPVPGFLKLFSQFIAMSLQGEAAGGAQPFVSLKFFRNLIIGLPPEAEQKAIVENVNALMGFCDSLENEIEQNTKQLEDLMQSCLREVFEGKEKEVVG